MAGKAEEFGDDDSRPFRFGSFWKGFRVKDSGLRIQGLGCRI